MKIFVAIIMNEFYYQNYYLPTVLKVSKPNRQANRFPKTVAIIKMFHLFKPWINIAGNLFSFFVSHRNSERYHMIWAEFILLSYFFRRVCRVKNSIMLLLTNRSYSMVSAVIDRTMLFFSSSLSHLDSFVCYHWEKSIQLLLVFFYVCVNEWQYTAEKKLMWNQ